MNPPAIPSHSPLFFLLGKHTQYYHLPHVGRAFESYRYLRTSLNVVSCSVNQKKIIVPFNFASFPHPQTHPPSKCELRKNSKP